MRELKFYAHAPGPNGTELTFSVFKRSSVFEVSGPNFEQHTCHPATSTRSKVLGEIALVFGVSTTRTSEPGREVRGCNPFEGTSSCHQDVFRFVADGLDANVQSTDEQEVMKGAA
jgi:hypothetical protein